ncbi:MAG: hypothetical protein J6K61_05890 [Clostridia bacterium]|nr:hypothetical protein [Clostridia bacterium]
MLKKLYLYDLRALWRILTPFLALAPVVGLIAFGIMELITVLEMRNLALNGTLLLLYFLCVVAIMLVSVAVMFFVVQRYYKNFFTDEGYLTLVLPATIEAQVTAKILSGVTWSLLSTVSLSVSLFFALGLPILRSLEIDFWVQSFSSVLEEMGLMFGGVNGVLSVISSLLSVFSQIVLLYTAITLGSLIIRKHKIFGSVLFYFVINALISAASGLFSFVCGLFLAGAETVEQIAMANTITHLTTILVNLAVLFGGYFCSCGMMKKRINLE